MRLKTVRVHGFKTFANPTEFHFQDGITAIVGPNGCGKSNIADAIRWALGEQAPSNLRTKRTEDLIFTGSTTRPKMGMAEVALTLENPFSFEEASQTNDPSMAFDARTQLGTSSERTMDNNGNEAIANGDEAPISNLQSSSNGDEKQKPRASVVEEILGARPNEVTILRRAYRSGENEYLINRQRVRLRDVQELLQRWGLARLTYAVIGQGLVDQALSLRAEERRALFEEAAGIGLYQNKKASALEKLEETHLNLIRVNDIINEIAPRLPSLARQADRASKYESVASALSANLKQWYSFNWAHAQEGFLAAQAQEHTARETLNGQRGAMQDLAAQLTESRRAAQALRARLTEHRRAQQQRETEFAARERELAVLQERARFAETQSADAQREVDAAVIAVEAALAAFQALDLNGVSLRVEEPQNIDAVVAEVVREQNAQAQAFLDAQLAELQEQVQKNLASETALDTHERELAESELAMEAEWHAETERLIPQLEQLDAQERTKTERAAHKLAEERALVELQRARAIAKQRLATLRLAEFETPAVPESAEAAPASPPPDLAAHLISLQEKLPLYEAALASVAGLAAQADDLARQEQALRERERLAERVRHEANDARMALTLAERDAQTAKQVEATVLRETERAERERHTERERAQRERERERERAREQVQREREKIARERERVRREQEQLVAQRERMVQEQARDQERERERARERELEKQREQEREQERAAREFTLEQERLTRERDRAARELETKAARVATFAAQLLEIGSARDAVRAQVDEMRAGLESLNQIAFPDEAALNESERLQTELEERETELRSALTVAEELHNRAVLEAERRRAEIARLEQEIEDDLGPVELNSAAPRQLRLRLVVGARPQSESPEPRASGGGDGTSAGTSGEDGQAQAAALSLEDGENATDAGGPEQELVTLPEVDALPDGFDKEIRRLKNQMRYIGNVNPNAPQEYAELKERHAFLTEQAADLTLAIEKLQLATHELDAMMKQKFLETFNAINVEFKKYFTLLFGGGSARLELGDPTDLIHSGIEISARPPGKRAAQLVLLSGGERALTAAALIFAILKVSPTPFCVMDEVDAALDEANVGRFREGLKELAHASQFIVITHNRVTMEGARAIYGVSMGEDGVSQVLSLKLEDQAATAEMI